MNFAQIKAIEKKNKERILKVCPFADEGCGIYILHRTDENGIKHAYIGQAKHLLTRLAQHLSGYQYIDLSLKKHGFVSDENPCGYYVNVLHCHENELDAREQEMIVQFALEGYQLKNRTSGGQGEGKKQIAEYRPARGYYDGLKQGYKNARRDVAKWVKWLKIDCDRSKKRAAQALERFKEFLEGEDGRG